MKTLKGIVLTVVLAGVAFISLGCDDVHVVHHRPRPVVVKPARRPVVVVRPRSKPRPVVVVRPRR